jgi:hypothetical protein
MAISLEELALGALEGSAGPWTLAVGAGALAVALAAGSARPVRRMAATGAFVAQRRGQLNLAGWLGTARQRWLALVAEARAEYEAGRQQPAGDAAPPTRTPDDQADTDSTPDTSGRVFVIEPAPAAPEPLASAPAGPEPVVLTPPTTAPTSDDTPPPARRDQRGRFVRRAANTNGTRSE